VTQSPDPVRLAGLAALLPMVEGQPLAMVALANQMEGAGQVAAGLELAARALALAPGDGEVRARASERLSDGVPSWHFTLVRDRLRNQAYDAALRRAVRPGCTVLEIGTGSGLLAMFAARAGAARVITCEADPAIAQAAREIIAANGFADRITVINKHSTALDPVADMGGPADLLVSEIVSNDMVGEETLPAHADALQRLLVPDAPVIPARGRIRVALAEDRNWVQSRMGVVDGFDLSAFNRLARPRRDIAVGSERLALRGTPADLFAFDFADSRMGERRTATPTLTATGGRINGVVQWIALEMDDAGGYENQPGPAARSCWSSVFWPFDRQIDAQPGEQFPIAAQCGDTHLRLWLTG
jgi:type II protein arginine methyltransferase